MEDNIDTYGANIFDSLQENLERRKIFFCVCKFFKNYSMILLIDFMWVRSKYFKFCEAHFRA